MRLLVLTSLAVLVAVVASTTPTATTAQLSTFKNSTSGPIGVLSTSSGNPVQENLTNTLNTDLLRNEYFLDSLTHLLNERIPERVLFAKGSGAFGYFVVTDNVTDLCKAEFLSYVGKQTPVVARFAPAVPSRGGSDIENAIRSFEVKFYTQEGNWDMAGVHTPIFPIRDPVKIASYVHSIKPNPLTDLFDFNTKWDFITLNPETFYSTLMELSSYGVPDGVRHMAGYSVHTMQLANADNETYFARFHFIPDLGLANLTAGSTTDVDYFVRDLYDAIGNSSFPSWTVYLQPLSVQDVLDARDQGVDVFDVTQKLSEETYPLRRVGKLVLNENPENYFADIEQLAISPANVVPGIIGAPDTFFVGRSIAYRTAQIHRLGINFNRIDVNRPQNVSYNYNRDGHAPVLNNGGGAPNYYPNNFNGPRTVATNQPSIYKFDEFVTSNFNQTSEFYESLTETEKAGVVTNIVTSLSGVKDALVTRVLDLLASVNEDLYDSVAAAVANSTSS